MKINSAALSRYYKANTVSAAADYASVSKQSCVRGASKIDTISISSEGCSQSVAGKIAKTVLGEIVQDDNSARIEEIRSAIENGSYQISAGAVADSILQRIFVE